MTEEVQISKEEMEQFPEPEPRKSRFVRFKEKIQTYKQNREEKQIRKLREKNVQLEQRAERAKLYLAEKRKQKTAEKNIAEARREKLAPVRKVFTGIGSMATRVGTPAKKIGYATVSVPVRHGTHSPLDAAIFGAPQFRKVTRKKRKKSKRKTYYGPQAPRAYNPYEGLI